jgi:hypothetical protein
MTTRNAYIILRRRPLGRYRRSERIISNSIRGECMDWIHVAQGRYQ